MCIATIAGEPLLTGRRGHRSSDVLWQRFACPATTCCGLRAASYPILPGRAALCIAKYAVSPQSLLHDVAAVLRLAQMPQLRRDARLTEPRELRQLAQRQPRAAERRAEQNVAQHFAL